MDNLQSGTNDRGLSGTCLNGNVDGGVAATRGRLGSGTGARASSLSDTGGSGGAHHHHHHHHAAGTATAPIITVVVRKDENGYGMKVSGDNPVYVQSVKEGGAAAKAGLHYGDKIIKVNGVDVSKSTHTEVVALIRSAAHVNLTVQQRPTQSSRPTMGSPALSHAGNRPLIHPHSNTRITAPQPVDPEILRELENKRVFTFRIMLENEERYADSLRSQLASFSSNTEPSKVTKVTSELANAEKNIGVLQAQLQSLLKNAVSELSASPSVSNTLPRPIPSLSTTPTITHSKSDNQITDKPPPLPERNRSSKSIDQTTDSCETSSPRSINKRFVFNDESHNLIANSQRFNKTSPKNFTPPLKSFPKMETVKDFLQTEINSNLVQNAQAGNKQYVIENQLYHSKNKKDTVDAHNNLIRNTMEYSSYASPSNRLIPRDAIVRSYSNSVDSKRYKHSSPTKTHQKSKTIGVPYNYNESKFYVDRNYGNFEIQQYQSGACQFEPEACPSDPIPPPLPPRIPLASPSTVFSTSPFPTSPASSSGCNDPDAVNSINKQMSYPLVATCAALVNHSCNSKSPHIVNTHHRTKSSPDPLTPQMSPTKKMTASESMNDLSENVAGSIEGWEMVDRTDHYTPPGTPPPPYPSPHMPRGTNTSGCSLNASGGSQRSSGDHSDGAHLDESPLLFMEHSSEMSPQQFPSSSPFISSSPIMAANSNVVQQPIISMEDELSDQEAEQIEDGPFKSFSRLLDHLAHLSVFMNYVLNNSDPSSILFYLITDLYKKDKNQAKDLKKWAYEIHSSFLVPGAPLHLRNVDENVARDIDDILFHESDKEEILRKIFWKARIRAKEEINEQLSEFRLKRNAGMGSFYGPHDSQLEESIHDKNKENSIVEMVLLKKLDPYVEEFEAEHIDPRKFTTAAALSTVFVRVFNLRQTHTVLERCPTFVSKDKSLRTRFVGKNRKLNLRGHHFIAHQYYTVTYCNHCQNLISGIGPQAYQCSNCNSNVHRHCVKVFEENCPGPVVKKEKGGYPISKIMGKIRPDLKSQSDTKRKASTTNFLHNERERRLMEEKDSQTDNEANNGERPFPSAPVSRTGSDRRSDASETLDTPDQEPENEQVHDNINRIQRPKSTQSSINRSESYKEQSQKRRQIRERRKVSDPNLSKSNDVEPDSQGVSYHTNSGSSSNSSLSSSSRSTSLETMALGCTATARTVGDSEPETERLVDPSDWASSVPEEVLARLSGCEKKRQDVFNELFQTERSHVRQLRVLETVFHKPLLNSNLLTPNQISLLFPNLEKMLEFHTGFSNSMKNLRKENPLAKDIGETLLNTFDGTSGESFKKEAATFCAKQQIALEWLKERRRKDPKLHAFLTECEADKTCKRLQLKDQIPTGMLRLTKYPLLFENLAKYTTQCLKDEDSINQLCSEELERIQRAHECSKEILNHVNATVREAEDYAKLLDIQKRLDRSGFEKSDHPLAIEFKNIDLTKHRLVHEGPLHWRIGTRQRINLHVLLLEDVIILLQKQDEKYSLKFHGVSAAGVDRGQMSPIIKVSTVLVRSNATDQNSLFLINTEQMGEHMYDLVASSPSESKLWFRHISEATEAYVKREGRSGRPDISPSVDTETENPMNRLEDNNRNPECDNTSIDESRTTDNISLSAQSQDGGVSPTDKNDDETSLENKRIQGEDDSPSVQGPNLGSQGSLNRFGAHSPLTYRTEQSQLIPPSEVHVSVRPVLTAEPVLTPLEQLRRKDELVKQILAEKEMLVADILNVPRDEFKNIAELAAEPHNNKEPTELVLAAINVANQLVEAMNDALNITEETAIALTTLPNAASSPLVVGCSGSSPKLNRLPGVPVQKLHSISATLNLQLTELLKINKEREEEREMIRRELHRSREQIHIFHEMGRLHPELMSSIAEESPQQTNQSNGSTGEQVENGMDNLRRSTMIENDDVIKEEPSDCEDEDVNDTEECPKDSSN